MVHTSSLASLRDAFVHTPPLRWYRSFLARPPATGFQAFGLARRYAAIHGAFITSQHHIQPHPDERGIQETLLTASLWGAINGVGNRAVSQATPRGGPVSFTQEVQFP